MSGTLEIPFGAFTYSRGAGGPLVAEHSCLAAQGYFQRGSAPAAFRMRGVRRTVLYCRAQERDVYAGQGSDRELQAMLYLPHPLYGFMPEVHVLND